MLVYTLMVFSGEMAVSLQPWYSSSFAAAILEGGQIGSRVDVAELLIRRRGVLLQIELCANPSSRPDRSHTGRCPSTSREAPGSSWEIAVQLVSLPGSLPGKISVPSLLLAGEYISFTDSSSAAVRQSSLLSPDLQAALAGSNMHLRGSLSRPSLTPSAASQALHHGLIQRGQLGRADEMPIAPCAPPSASIMSQACRWVW